MAGEREMAQHYAKAGLGAAFVMNGGAAVAVLSQASELIRQGLADEVGCALLLWAVGVAVVPLGWLLGFLSLRHVDRSNDHGADFGAEIGKSNRYMFFGVALFILSVALFLWGSVSLAQALVWADPASESCPMASN